VHRPPTKLLAQPGVHGLRHAGLGDGLVAPHRDVVLAYVVDAPLDEGIDQNGFLLGRQKALRIDGLQRQDAAIEEADVLDQRPLEIEAGFPDDFLDFAQLEEERVLALIDGIQAHAGNDQQAENHRTDERQILGHVSDLPGRAN
jgi:hypothetical protein